MSHPSGTVLLRLTLHAKKREIYLPRKIEQIGHEEMGISPWRSTPKDVVEHEEMGFWSVRWSICPEISNRSWRNGDRIIRPMIYLPRNIQQIVKKWGSDHHSDDLSAPKYPTDHEEMGICPRVRSNRAPRNGDLICPIIYLPCKRSNISWRNGDLTCPVRARLGHRARSRAATIDGALASQITISSLNRTQHPHQPNEPPRHVT